MSLGLFTDSEVVYFNSPQEALEAFGGNPSSWELVISDLDMPGMSGIELCHSLRMLAPDLKTILATGSCDISEAEVLREGFGRLVRKPYTPRELEAAVRFVFSQDIKLMAA